MKGLARRAEEGGLLFTLLVAAAVAGAFLTMYLRPIRGLAPLPLPGDTTVQTVAREPGVAYDVLKFCNDPATKVHGPTLPVPEDAGRLIAERGIEIVNWPGPGSLAAQHYYTSSTGQNMSEPVEMTPAAAACMTKKAGKK